MASPQTLTETERRLLAAWSADCAERVLPLLGPGSGGHADAVASIARARAFASGELGVGEAIRQRFGERSRDQLAGDAARAASRAAGQAGAVAHMGAHALGAAGWAALAKELDAGASAQSNRELRWQLGHLTEQARAALATLPRIGEDGAGPLAPGGLLARGRVGELIARFQEAVHAT